MGASNRYAEEGWVRIGLFDYAQRRSMWVRRTADVIELCAGREGDDVYTTIDRSNPAFRGIDDVIGTAIFARDQLIDNIACSLIHDPSPGSESWIREAFILSADLQRAVASDLRCACSPTHEHVGGAYLTDTCPVAVADWMMHRWPERLAGGLHLASQLRDLCDRNQRSVAST